MAGQPRKARHPQVGVGLQVCPCGHDRPHAGPRVGPSCRRASPLSGQSKGHPDMSGAFGRVRQRTPTPCRSPPTSPKQCTFRSIYCAAECKLCPPRASCDCSQRRVCAGNGCLLSRENRARRTASDRQASLARASLLLRRCNGFCDGCQPGSFLCAAIRAGQQGLDTADSNGCSNGLECTGVRNAAALNGPVAHHQGRLDGMSLDCEQAPSGGARVCCSQACDAPSDADRAVHGYGERFGHDLATGGARGDQLYSPVVAWGGPVSAADQSYGCGFWKGG
jgi:hypothetical protein